MCVAKWFIDYLTQHQSYKYCVYGIFNKSLTVFLYNFIFIIICLHSLSVYYLKIVNR